MKAAAFSYQRPATVAEAGHALGGTDSAAKAIGGGQSLGPMLNLRLVRTPLLVDVSELAELRAIERQAGGLWIGGATTHAEIEDGKLDALLQDTPPLAQLLRHVAGTIAYRAVRNRGTLAGSLAHADPAADWVLAMTALDATLHCASQTGRRTIPMTQFMSGAFSTALNNGELLAGVSLPEYSAALRWGYYKFCRKTGEFAEASCATVFDPRQGVARIVIGALDGAPAQLPELAVAVAREGLAALSDEAVARAVTQAVGGATSGRDEAQGRLTIAAVKRSVRQALGAA
jgi:carbon-monoxide dehydrogenase medium subunit